MCNMHVEEYIYTYILNCKQITRLRAGSTLQNPLASLIFWTEFSGLEPLTINS